ncbi:MAG: ABC transporter permease [Oscillospiraceae bacterium]|nr:ABC transporter permease [Oscillospiraceae bacterium]
MGFGNLLKKELGQLLTRQAIFSMIFTMALFIMLGQVMGNTMGKLDELDKNDGTITLINLDTGDLSKKMLDDFRAEGTAVKLLSYSGNGDDYSSVLEENDLKSILIIPEGFSADAESGKSAKLKFVTKVTGTGLANMIDSGTDGGTPEMISDYLQKYYHDNFLDVTEEQIETYEAPSTVVQFTVANGRTAEIAPEMVSGMLMAVSVVMPMAIFFLLMMASQMIMTAISTEKIDKTLETLLSSPVSRIGVLVAKVVAAIVVALLNALTTMIGFAFYLNGMTGNKMASMMNVGPASSEINEAINEAVTTNPVEALMQLGIGISGGQIFLVFLELFIGLAIGLCASLIIGAMATDIQSLSTLLMPVMILTMVPFFITMFMDINSMSIVPKMILYAIPFTHTYTALNNLIFQNHAAFIGGLVYQLVFLGGTMYAAVKVFTTDLLFTMKLPEKQAAGKSGPLFGKGK